MYKKVEEILGYNFKNKALLKEAFTHTSFANERNINPLLSNERLEFLGDAVLDLVVSNYLFTHFKHLKEGQLSKFRAAVVCEGSFANMSRKLGLGQFLMLGKGEVLSGGMDRESILADVFEAIMGAIYLDSSFENVEKIIIGILEDEILKLRNTFESKDYKTMLQEIIQGKSQEPIYYNIVSEEGPAHDKVFGVEVMHKNKKIGHGLGKSKKEAEQNSAKDYLKKNNYV